MIIKQTQLQQQQDKYMKNKFPKLQKYFDFFIENRSLFSNLIWRHFTWIFWAKFGVMQTRVFKVLNHILESIGYFGFSITVASISNSKLSNNREEFKYL